MKIAFWSGVRKTGGVTGNLAAISCVLAFQFHCDVILGSNHISNQMVRDCFFSRVAEEGTGREPYYFCYGESDYFRKLWEIEMSQKENRMDIQTDWIQFIRPPEATDKQMFYYDVPPNALYLLDTAGKCCFASGSALEEADLVAVFLPQDSTEIRKFFERYSSLIPKAVFFINDYRKDGDCIPRTLASRYKLDINCIGVIPHCNDYVQACEEGNLASFLKENLNCSTRNPNFYYIKNIKNAAKMIFNHFECKNIG